MNNLKWENYEEMEQDYFSSKAGIRSNVVWWVKGIAKLLFYIIEKINSPHNETYCLYTPPAHWQYPNDQHLIRIFTDGNDNVE